ncbi:MAG: DUF2818 family protein [Rhodocyclaceae bacterium]
MRDRLAQLHLIGSKGGQAMDIGIGRALLLALFIAAANLPFLSHRVFGLIAWRRPHKPFWIILLEWAALFALLGGLCALIESRLYGSVYAQGWQFYFVGLFLFAVFAFPGYVFRYLLARPGKPAR